MFFSVRFHHFAQKDLSDTSSVGFRFDYISLRFRPVVRAGLFRSSRNRIEALPRPAAHGVKLASFPF